MKGSLRQRLLLGIAATTLVGLTLTAVVSFLAISQAVLREFDDLLAGKARTLATHVEQHGHEITANFVDRPMQEFARKIRPEYFQLWDEDGTVLARSRRLGTSNLDCKAGALAAPSFRTTALPDGRPGRLVSVQFLPAVQGESLDRPVGEAEDDPEEATDQVDFSGRRRVTLVVAKETAQIDRTLSNIGWALCSISTGVISVMCLALAWIVGRSLRPLEDLAEQIARLDEQGLHASVQLANAPAELTPVVIRLNELLTRLAGALQRERTFTANMAHELRTPLAGLRTMFDVVLGRSRPAVEYRRVLKSCQSICEDTHELVTTLLNLARIDAGWATVDRSFVDLDVAVKRSWIPVADKARERRLTFNVEGPAGTFLQTDAAMLRVVLANLFDNAVEYADQGGTIACRWRLDSGGGLNLSVANSGCELNRDQCERVFDRFWRADEARSAVGLHAGLGLSLCQKIVDTLGGSIRATVEDRTFVIEIGFGAPFVEAVETNEDETAISGDPVQSGAHRAAPSLVPAVSRLEQGTEP